MPSFADVITSVTLTSRVVGIYMGDFMRIV